MLSLPPKVPKRLRDISEVISAYHICLKFEKFLQLAVDRGENFGNNLIYNCILGYLVHYMPTDQELKSITGDISSCAHNSAILDVGKMYYGGACIYVFKSTSKLQHAICI